MSCLNNAVTIEYLEQRLEDYASRSALSILENLIYNLFPNNNNNQDYGGLIDSLLSSVSRLNNEVTDLRNELRNHTSLNYSVAHGGINLSPYALRSDVNAVESSLNSHIRDNNAHGVNLSLIQNQISSLNNSLNNLQNDVNNALNNGGGNSGLEGELRQLQDNFNNHITSVESHELNKLIDALAAISKNVKTIANIQESLSKEVKKIYE